MNTLLAKLPVRAFPTGFEHDGGITTIQLLATDQSTVCYIRREPNEPHADFAARVNSVADLINGLGRKVDVHA
jgi:hypothetical protein